MWPLVREHWAILAVVLVGVPVGMALFLAWLAWALDRDGQKADALWRESNPPPADR